MKQRFWEVDFLRGIAILMMALFHLLYDLQFFNICNINVHSGFWMYFARITAITFIFLVGVSLTLSYSKAKRPDFAKYLKRGLKIFSWGLLITLATFFFARDAYIIFGILHMIGISIILAYPLIRYKFLNLILGILTIIIGFLIDQIRIDSYLLVWLGIMPYGFRTLDYFPILPWFGAVLLGIFVGNSLYKNYRRTFKFPNISNPLTNTLSYLGKHSLFIYLIHQPILIGIVLLIRFLIFQS